MKVLPVPRDTAVALLGALLACGVFLFLGSVPLVRFTRERIEVTVRPASIEVDGLYIYENPWPVAVTQGLKYPILSDDRHPLPDSIEVTDTDPATGRDLGPILTLKLGRTPYYSVRVPAKGVRHIRVRYTQEAEDSAGAYLLTTTKPWRRPLEKGEYLLKPQGVAITSSSYPLDGREPFSFVRRHFMPDKEWEFTWRKG
ncbi:MAG: hypothetical protein WC943_13305 [Elusimicrobiota bacterium]|jgi:hypothetical protein